MTTEQEIFEKVMKEVEAGYYCEGHDEYYIKELKEQTGDEGVIRWAVKKAIHEAYETGSIDERTKKLSLMLQIPPEMIESIKTEIKKEVEAQTAQAIKTLLESLYEDETSLAYTNSIKMQAHNEVLLEAIDRIEKEYKLFPYDHESFVGKFVKKVE